MNFFVSIYFYVIIFLIKNKTEDMPGNFLLICGIFTSSFFVLEILVEMSLAEIKKIPLISLPYLKKRLRRITALGFRNLTINQTNFSIYFTLHQNDKTIAFYTSESVANKRSPEWSYLRFPKNIQLLNEFLIRIWVVASNTSRLFLEYDIHLDDSLIPDEQKDDSRRSNNSLWLEMFGHRFSDNESVLDTKKPTRIILPGRKSKGTSMAKSYDSSSLQRMINTIESTGIEKRSSIECLDRLQTFFNDHEHYLFKKKERELRKVRLDHLKQHFLSQVSNYQRRLNSNQYRQKLINERRNQLNQNLLQLLAQQKELNQHITHLNQSKCLLHDLMHLIHFRQKDMISEIYRCVYPITSENKTEFSIANIRLLPAEDKSYLSLTREREYEIGAAVGYCVHIVLLISQFLQLPLRFPIDYFGAVSIKIYDYSQSKSDFPLSPTYNAGSFEYGLFLLNRNIGQIMAHCRMGNRHPDYRKTLENLKDVLEHYFVNAHENPFNQLFALSQPSIEPTILLNSSTTQSYLRNKRNSTANAVFSPSRSAVSSTIEMNDDEHNDDDTHEVDFFPTLNTIPPRLAMQFSQQQ